MATLNLADGESFVKGRSTTIARTLIEAAGDRAGEVRTTSYGYILPTELVPEGQAAITNADLPAVTTEPGTPTNVEDVYNKGGERKAPVGTPLAEADNAPATLRRSVPEGTADAGAFKGDQGVSDTEVNKRVLPEIDGEHQFDPSTATVDQVAEYLADVDDEERARVIAAEEAGKQRKGVLDLADTEEGK